MRIEHIAIWVKDLESMKSFYMKYFNMKSSAKYVNEKKQFSSYFLSFPGGARLEIMHRTDIVSKIGNRGEVMGLTHLAYTVGSREKVVELTEQLRKDGYQVYSEARTTGDGYFESVVLDPEGNHLEITE